MASRSTAHHRARLLVSLLAAAAATAFACSDVSLGRPLAKFNNVVASARNMDVSV